MTDTTDNGDGQSETITLYEAIGGDAAVRALTHRFYVLMDTLPEAARCRAIHPPDLSGSEEKLYEYLTGWLGGPPLYTEKRGHPMPPPPHFVAPVGPAARDQRPLRYSRALGDTVPSQGSRAGLLEHVTRLAPHLQNQE